jgi:hypothetical protein
MDLIGGHRRMLPVGRGAPLHPGGVLPDVGRARSDNRCIARPHLEASAVGIGFGEHLAAVPVPDLEAIEDAGGDVRNEQLPYAAPRTHAHRVATTVPVIEVTQDAHTLGIGCPDGEQDASDAVNLMFVCPQELIGVAVPAFAEKVQIEIRYLRQVAIRIVGNMVVMPGITPDQAIVFRKVLAGTLPLEKVGIRNTFQRQIAFDDGNFRRVRDVGPHHNAFSARMPSQHRKRIVVASLGDSDQFVIQLGFYHDSSFPRSGSIGCDMRTTSPA